MTPDGATGSVTADDLTAILEDFKERANENRIVRKMLKDWTRNIQVTATDLGRVWTIVVDNGTVLRIAAGPVEPRHVHIQSDAEALAGIFRGEKNPVEEFSKGNLKFTGSARDEMRIDAVIQYIWDD
ncbi:MAG TPA: hypothetical protein DHW14_05115 [Clostridiales bacterium]|nr:hypothetical protein [Clostridiales bacterium]